MQDLNDVLAISLIYINFWKLDLFARLASKFIVVHLSHLSKLIFI